METRLFKSEIESHEEKEQIVAVSSDELKKYYDAYDTYYLNNEIDLSDLEKRDEHWVADSYIISEVDKDLLDHWKNQHSGCFTEEDDEIIVSNEDAAKKLCFYASFDKESEPDYVQDKTVWVLDDDFREIELSEWSDEVVAEGVEFWDGSNWKTIFYVDHFGYSGYEEVTDDFPNWEEMDEVTSTYGNGGTGHKDFLVYSDGEKRQLIVKNVSYWQGSIDTYEVADEEEMAVYAMRYPELKEVFPEVIVYILSDFKSHLKKGENIRYEEGEFIMSYRSEVYHFSDEEVVAYLIGEYFYSDNPLENARAQIEKRRDEKYLQIMEERFSKLPLDKIWVSRADSLEAGNCESHTDAFRQEVAKDLGVSGDFALRADELVGKRDDSYTRRAVIQAYLKKQKMMA